MNEFLPKVAEILEVESVTPDFKFRETADWDSMFDGNPCGIPHSVLRVAPEEVQSCV